jgi:hypothetical protein
MIFVMKRINVLLFLMGTLIALPVTGQKTIGYLEGSTEKIEQLIGDWDKERNVATKNRTFERFQLPNTDLGVPFQHNNKTYVCFGDVWIDNGDPLGYTTDTVAEDGISLDFVTNPDGSFKKISIPGVSLSGFEVPMEGVSWNDIMYLYCTTDIMTKSVVAKSTDEGQTFTKLYDVSQSKFINISLLKGVADENYPVPSGTEIQIMFGSGSYRESSVYLAFQRGDQIGQRSIYFFYGLDNSGNPKWSPFETAALPMFDQPCVGELSISYNKFIKQWILTYNCGNPRGINCRVADNPWGPWSEPFVIFDPAEGYCHFMHKNWLVGNCDNVHDVGRENEWGGEYGPYQFDQLATGNAKETTIYYTMSTWNPYSVVLMKSTLVDLSVSSSPMVANPSDRLEVFPNPASNYISVRIELSTPAPVTISIWNATGQLIHHRKIKTALLLNEFVLETGEYPPGLYSIVATPEGSKQNLYKKILITNMK